MPIEYKSSCYIYAPKTPFEHLALDNVNLMLDEGRFIAIVGRTGSGKSTVIQLLNALLVPTSGEVNINAFLNCPKSGKPKKPKKKEENYEESLKAYKERLTAYKFSHSSKGIKKLRGSVGLVFQFPEYQLFEDSVEKDVSFGPRNFGIDKKKSLALAHEALKKVGLDESFYDRSPFELSGGEKRKVAIAGILAMKPSILVVDEPTAGLDPAAAKEMMSLFKDIQSEGVTIILVTHDMDLVASYADDVVVMNEGKMVEKVAPSELFGDDLSKYSLRNPRIFEFASNLSKKGMDIDRSVLRSVKDLAKAIARKRNG